MRRVLVDQFGAPVYPSPGTAYTVANLTYRVSDDGNPEGDLMIVEVIPSSAFYVSMAALPITSVR